MRPVLSPCSRWFVGLASVELASESHWRPAFASDPMRLRWECDAMANSWQVKGHSTQYKADKREQSWDEDGRKVL